ncbi:hypothetical protein [Sulfitobacter geojensis]|uniref:hypothetical protein n=1 Tax=Sulfitobacter geojensis TaxID=1342299 RepID=UPI000AA08F1C|nr:hypothetical protein [Sulfitobacter geojensis]
MADRSTDRSVTLITKEQNRSGLPFDKSSMVQQITSGNLMIRMSEDVAANDGRLDSPEIYAKFRFEEHEDIVPEALQQLLGHMTISRVPTEQLQEIAKLADEERAVSQYVLKWLCVGVYHNHKPDKIPVAFMPLVISALQNGGYQIVDDKAHFRYSDEQVRDVACLIHLHFGLSINGPEMWGAIGAALGKSPDSIRKKLLDAGKGIQKESRKKKLEKQNVRGARSAKRPPKT